MRFIIKCIVYFIICKLCVIHVLYQQAIHIYFFKFLFFSFSFFKELVVKPSVNQQNPWPQATVDLLSVTVE